MSVYILGVGSAHPSTEIAQAIGAPTNSSGASCPGRRSTLPASYIRDTGNADPQRAVAAASESPTDLAHRAAVAALERAGIAPEQVGLILGDSSTPRETTPSEAQRLGKRLNLKTRAYDVLASSATFIQHLSVLNDWDCTRVPDYVMSVSANAPSEYIRFGGPHVSPFGGFFGDGAAVGVCSVKHPGKLMVQEAWVNTVPARAQILRFETYGFIEGDFREFVSESACRFEECFDRAMKGGALEPSLVKLIAGGVDTSVLEPLCDRYEISEDNRWYRYTAQFGDCLGATPGVALSHFWDAVKDGDQILILTVGPGLTYGYAVLKG